MSVYSTIEQFNTFTGGANTPKGNGDETNSTKNAAKVALVANVAANATTPGNVVNDSVLEQPKFNYRNLFIFIALLAGAYMGIMSSSDDTFKNAASLIVISVGLVGFFFYLSYYQYRCVKHQQHVLDGLPYDDSITLYLNNDLKVLDAKTIAVGLVAGVVFGFIDNAGLFFGMSNLEAYFPQGSADDDQQTKDNVKAGWGNTFSDCLGSFLSVFIANIISNMTKVNQTPIWTESIGIIIGCILGIYIPKAIAGKKINRA